MPTVTYGPASALDAVLAAANMGQGAIWPAGPHAQFVARDQVIGTELMPNPTPIPSTLILQGFPPLIVPGATLGQVLTSDAAGNITAQPAASVFGTPLAGPSPSQQTVWRQADGSVLVIPLAYYSLGGDDNTWLASAFTFATTALAGSPATYLGGVGQVGGRVTLWPYAVYSVATTVVVPPGCELRGASGSVIAFSGTGPAIQAQGAQIGNQVIQGVGTRLYGFTVDGTAVGASALAGGIEVGGQYSVTLDSVTVTNFTSTGTDNSANSFGGYYPLGAYGISVCARNTLTEKLILRNVTIDNCGPPNLTATPPSQAGGAAIQFVHPVSSTVGTYTATNASPAVFTVTGAAVPVLNNQLVQLSGGSPPAGFTNGTNYYTVAANAAGTAFSLAATLGGAPIASTSTGSGSVIAPGAVSGSVMYAFIHGLQLAQQPGQNGIVLARDGKPMYCTAVVKGNMFSPGSGTNGCAALVVGVGTVANHYQAHISLANLDINVEATNNAGGTTQPYSIWFGPDPDNAINNCRGFMRFSGFRSATNSPNFFTAGISTTVAAGSNGGTIANIASWANPSPGVLAVASTAGLPAGGGQLTVATSGTTAVINFTGISGATVTGCTFVSGSGTVSTGGAVLFYSPSISWSGQIWGDTGLAGVGAPVASPALGVGYTNQGSDTVVYVSGGPPTQILINNVATGITSGPVKLPMNATLKFSGGVAPSWAWFTDVVNG